MTSVVSSKNINPAGEDARAIGYFGMSLPHFGSPSVELKKALPKAQLL